MLKNDKKMIEKMNYIGLDFDNIPEDIRKTKTLDFRITKFYYEKQYRQYKFIPVKDIQILLTPTNRLDSLEEKYKKSSPLNEYLDNKREKNVLKHTRFLKMLKETKISDIEKVEEEQKMLNKMLPFKVKFEGNYLWQIYYSESTDKYFMLVPIEDADYSTFFYLLKRQIKEIPNDKIFVPISNTQYSRKYFNKQEFEDIENYIWFFTKDWPLIYEVYNKKEEMKIQIVGETTIYEKIKTKYKIVLKSKQEASEFYKLIKALFILQTEVPHYFNFNTRINKNASIKFYLEDKNITFENLADIIKEKYDLGKEKIKETEQKITKYSEMLQKLKEISAMQEMEYLNKEKQITTFLECKKSFFGKFKYYFKYGKNNKGSKENKQKVKDNNSILDDEQNKKAIIKKGNKKYTLEELIEEYKELEKIEIQKKNLLMDINALKLKNKNTKKKIENASNFIQDIDNHKKSIFEFWKYANKDEVSAVSEGEKEEENVIKKIEKTFDYTEDIEKFGKNLDIMQRKVLSKEETDSIYIATTEILKILNNLKYGNLQSQELEDSLKKLKIEAKKEKALSEEEFDIFGSIIEDKTKIKQIKNKQHRELPKDKFNILGINKNTRIIQYRAELEKIIKNVYEAILKITIQENISIYKATGEEIIDASNINMFNINPEIEIKEAVKNENKRINFYKINIPKGTNGIGITNNILYDNQNKTLPIGMDLSSNIIVDISKLHLKLIKRTVLKKLCFKNEKDDFIKPEIKNIIVFEYEVL